MYSEESFDIALYSFPNLTQRPKLRPSQTEALFYLPALRAKYWAQQTYQIGQDREKDTRTTLKQRSHM